MCIANNNLLPAQNVLKIYASEIKSCTSHHVEHNAAIGIQIGYHMKEIKYLLKKLHVRKKKSGQDFRPYCSSKVTFVSVRGRRGLNPRGKRGRALAYHAIGRALSQSEPVKK